MTEHIRITDPVDSEKEIRKLRMRLDSHIQDYREHILEEERRYLQEMQKQAALAANVEQLMIAQKLQVEATQGLVDAWNAAAFLQRFVKWLGGFAVIGAAVAWYNDLFIK